MTGKIHRLQCDEPWFSHLRSGRKPVEGRKNSPRYQSFKSGDIIEFHNDHASFRASVTEIRRYDSLESYLHDVGVDQALPGVNSLEEGLQVYLQWSTSAEIQQYGFLGIFVRPLLVE